MIISILKSSKSFMAFVLSLVLVFSISVKSYAFEYPQEFEWTYSLYLHIYTPNLAVTSKISDDAIYTFTIKLVEALDYTSPHIYNDVGLHPFNNIVYQYTGAEIKALGFNGSINEQACNQQIVAFTSQRMYKLYAVVTIENGTLPNDNPNDWSGGVLQIMTDGNVGGLIVFNEDGTGHKPSENRAMHLTMSNFASGIIDATDTPTPTPTGTYTPTPTPTETYTPTPISTITPNYMSYTTPTFTPQPSATQTPVNNLTPIVTATNTVTPTITATPTNTLEHSQSQTPENYNTQSADYENPDPVGENSAAAQSATSQTVNDDDNSYPAEVQKEIVTIDGVDYYYDEFGNLVPYGSGKIDKKNPETRSNPMILIITIFLQLAAAAALYITFKKRKHAQRK
ncbi:MAG: hypothetical protein LBQ68_00050 [Clostridiales bacterium]|nr:hypothetical protein [Clostridiales bacterium]